MASPMMFISRVAIEFSEEPNTDDYDGEVFITIAGKGTKLSGATAEAVLRYVEAEMALLIEGAQSRH